MPNKKKPALSPEAARVLEQYRKAGQKATGAGGDATADSSTTSTARPTSPPMAPVHRSGTRGK